MEATIRYFVLVLLLACAGWTYAQSPSLPSKLSGKWVYVAPNGKVYSDKVEMSLDPPSASGVVTGRISTVGVTCGSKDEPLTGTWDGARLQFRSKAHANVNTQMANGNCGSGQIDYDLVQKGPGQFEGEAKRPEMPGPSQVMVTAR